VTAVLDHVSEAVLVDSPQTALAVLDHLDEDSLVDLAVAPGGTADRAGESGEAPALPPADPAESVPVRRLVRTSDDGLSALLDSALAAVVTAPDAASAVAALRRDPECTFVTPAGEVISAARIRRTGSTEGARIATRAALEETEQQVSVLEARIRERAAA